jgi:hypothetical protein
MEMNIDRYPKPSALATMFMSVPEIADTVVKHLDPHDTVRLMTRTEPALTIFCHSSGGGIDRLLDISGEGKRKRDILRRLPSLPRLLEEEWQRKLIGKRLVAKKVEDDDTVGFRVDPLYACFSVLSLLACSRELAVSHQDTLLEPQDTTLATSQNPACSDFPPRNVLLVKFVMIADA